MPEETKEMLADVVAKSLEEAVPSAVEAAMDVKLKELSLSENADFKEMKSQMKELVEKSRLGGGGEENLKQLKDDFATALKALKNGNAEVVKAMMVGNDVDGGYLVHPEFEKGVYRVMEKYGIWKDCDIYRMNSNTKYFITRKTGLQVFYQSEGLSYQDTSMTYDRKEMIAKKIGAILNVTYELIEDEADSDEIWNKAQEEFAQAFSYFLDKEILQGTGDANSNSNIKGIMNLRNVNVVTLEGGTESLTSDALIDATRKVPLKYKENSKPCWYMSQDAIALIEKLKDNDGRPLYRTLDNGEKGYLLGYPVVLSDAMPQGTIAKNKAFIIFGSLKYFAIGIKKGFSFEFGYRQGGWEKDIKSLKASVRICGLALSEDAFSIIKTAAA